MKKITFDQAVRVIKAHSNTYALIDSGFGFVSAGDSHIRFSSYESGEPFYIDENEVETIEVFRTGMHFTLLSGKVINMSLVEFKNIENE